ncbi:hypothetical protein ACWC9R_11950 [Streptomyces sp. NPDC001219]
MTGRQGALQKVFVRSVRLGHFPRDNVSHREVSLDFLRQRGGTMGRVLRMPTEEQLPPGPRREFVKALFSYYRSASRPTLRTIAELMRQKSPDATGSPETVRRTLLGLSVPTSWSTVDSLLVVLCDLAQIDPEPAPVDDDLWIRSGTRAEIKALWNAVLDGADEGDLWGREGTQTYPEPPEYSDEPPF